MEELTHRELEAVTIAVISTIERGIATDELLKNLSSAYDKLHKKLHPDCEHSISLVNNGYVRRNRG